MEKVIYEFKRKYTQKEEEEYGHRDANIHDYSVCIKYFVCQ